MASKEDLSEIYPHINTRLAGVCDDVTRYTYDMLPVDGELTEEAAEVVATDPEIRALQLFMACNLELDRRIRLGDPTSSVVLRIQDPFYVVNGVTEVVGGIYSNLTQIDSAGAIKGTPAGVRLAYVREAVDAPFQPVQYVPGIKLCLAVAGAQLNTVAREGAEHEVLVPFSEYNQVYPPASYEI